MLCHGAVYMILHCIFVLGILNECCFATVYVKH